MKRLFFVFLPVAVILTLIWVSMYLLVQQSLRIGANDPQIRIAQDIVNSATSEKVLNDGAFYQIDISESLSPFIMLFDQQGNVIKSTGTLHGVSPILPAQVLSYVATFGEDRITWQPEKGVRIAAVIDKLSGDKKGFVLVGRNLREIESRENYSELVCGFGWIACLFVAFVTTIFSPFPQNKK